MLAHDEARRIASRRVREQRATLEDVRLLSVGPLSENGYLHARALMVRAGKRVRGGAVEDHHQTSGAQQFARVLAQRSDPAARWWLDRIRQAEAG